MKRTNLVLDEELLDTATRLLGAKTYSAAVNRALEEVIRLARIRDLASFVGTGVWEGSLPEMRADRATPGRATRRRGRR
jgi:Arc/MetJ family transcription regulator